MRRLILSMSLAYLLVAFSFIALTILNASVEGSVVVMLETDAQVVLVMSLIGIAATVLLGIRILADSIARRDIDRQMREPRRKSDLTRDDRPR